MSEERTIRLTADGAGEPDLGRGSVFFVGTATVILRFAGFTILTDPNFLHAGDHVHLGYGLTSRRLTEPALDIDELPPIDFVVLSHYHGDHFDHIVEERLAKDLPIVTTKHAAGEVSAKGFTGAIPLETWEAVVFEKGGARVRVAATPGKHGPGVVEVVLPPVNGHVLDFGRAGGAPAAFRLYVTGDTLVHDELAEIPRRYPAIDLALFHLGGTRILGLLLTMDAEQGVEAIRIVDPRELIPIHYDDYEVFRSPLDDFRRAVEAAGYSDRVRYLARGETYEFVVPAERDPAPG
jgi:L-ascorbate metabolism protein UlaG (beta-lactamase superfamily)